MMSTLTRKERTGAQQARVLVSWIRRVSNNFHLATRKPEGFSLVRFRLVSKRIKPIDARRRTRVQGTSTMRTNHKTQLCIREGLLLGDLPLAPSGDCKNSNNECIVHSNEREECGEYTCKREKQSLKKGSWSEPSGHRGCSERLSIRASRAPLRSIHTTSTEGPAGFGARAWAAMCSRSAVFPEACSPTTSTRSARGTGGSSSGTPTGTGCPRKAARLPSLGGAAPRTPPRPRNRAARAAVTAADCGMTRPGRRWCAV
jgi:hypothetical protein